MFVKKEIKKIGILKPRGIGDVVLSTVVIDNLISEFPGVELYYLTEAPSVPAVNPLKQISGVIKLELKNFFGLLRSIRKIRKEKFDLLFDFYSNPKTAQITLLSGAKYRAGFPYRGRKYAYNIYGPSERGIFHAAQLHIEFLKLLGINYSSANLHFGLEETDRTFAEKFFSENNLSHSLVCGIIPGGGWQSKRCDPIKFAEIADSVIEKFNAKILLLWGPGDKAEADEIKKLSKNNLLLAPPTTINQLGALIEKCSFVIANDSGPMHISTAVGTPTLALHGPTDPKMQGPFGKKHEYIRLEELECIGCNLLDCPRNHECFLQLPTERVIGKIQTLFIKNKIEIAAS